MVASRASERADAALRRLAAAATSRDAGAAFGPLGRSRGSWTVAAVREIRGGVAVELADRDSGATAEIAVPLSSRAGMRALAELDSMFGDPGESA